MTPHARLYAGGCALLMASVSSGVAAPAAGPLRPSRANPRYFEDGRGRIVYLAGYHDGWELQDFAWGDENPGVRFPWEGFLEDVAARGANAMRLWCVEHARIDDRDPDTTSPMPYARVPGRGKAKDGGDRFDLDRFDEAYFARLRARAHAAGRRGIYVIVMLFQGFSIEDKGGRVNPWPYHPFHRGNNVNGVDGDLDGDGRGTELHTWLGEDHPITRRQRAYVRRVVDAVNDLDNVLFEIANESHPGSLPWQSRMVDFIHAYERTKAKRHPVGITVPWSPGMPRDGNAALFRSPADWISPNRHAPRPYSYRDDPPPADGRKVILLDTDHLYGDRARDPTWVWKAFCRGHNPLYMDRWTFERADPAREAVRRALGRTVRLARRLDLAAMVPHPELASTRYCLADPGRAYLAYAPEGGPIAVDLANAAGPFRIAWIDPRHAAATPGGTARGGARRTFRPPFPGEAVLHLAR